MEIKSKNDQQKKDHDALNAQTQVVKNLKKLRDTAYEKHGLKIDEPIKNMPPALKQADDKYQEGIKKMYELKEKSQKSQEDYDLFTAEANKKSYELVEKIEEAEYTRLNEIKTALTSFSQALSVLFKQNDQLHKLLDTEVTGIDPFKDMQSFIQKNSTYADNDRLRNLYKNLNLYHIDEKQGGALGDNALSAITRAIQNNLTVEKTSRSMA